MGSRKLSTLTIDLQATTNQHNASINKARGTLSKYSTQARTANSASKGLSQGFGSAANQASVLYGPLNGISGRLSAVSTGLNTMGVAGFAGAAGLAAVVLAAGQGLSVFGDWERQQFKTAALIRSTGSAAGLTAAQLEDLARATAMSTLGSVEGARDAINVLQTFKTVQGDVFTSAIGLTEDMAAVMGGDAKSAAVQLGKALEDPTTGLNALKRSGVSFSETEKEVIKDLQATNRLAEAQGLILAKLTDQVGGAGAGQAKGLHGSLDSLGQVYDEFLFDLTETSALGSAATDTINTLTKGISRFHKSLMPDDDVRLNELTAQRIALKAELEEMGKIGVDNLPDINPFGHSKNSWRNAQVEHSRITAEMRAIQDKRMVEQKAQSAAQDAAAKVASDAQAEQDAATERKRAQKAAAQAAKDAQTKSAQQQAASRTSLSSMDLLFADEQGKLALQNQKRLSDIDALQLSEAEIKRAGFEDIAALRAEYKARSEAQYTADQAALTERDLAEVEQVRTQLLSKEAVELEAWQRRQTTLADAFTRGLIDEQSYQAISTKSWKKYQDNLDKQEAARQAAQLRNAADLFGGLAGLTKAFGGEQSKAYKVMFAASKAFAVAESIISIQQGLSKAWSLGFPLGIPAAATVLSQTAGIVSTISGTSMAGMAHDGIDNIPQEGTWLLDKGERVVDRRTNGDLKSFLSGGGNSGNSSGAMVVNVHNYSNQSVETEENGQQLDIIIGRAKAAIAEDVARGVGISKTFEHTFNLSRKGVV